MTDTRTPQQVSYQHIKEIDARVDAFRDSDPELFDRIDKSDYPQASAFARITTYFMTQAVSESAPFAADPIERDKLMAVATEYLDEGDRLLDQVPLEAIRELYRLTGKGRWAKQMTAMYGEMSPDLDRYNRIGVNRGRAYIKEVIRLRKREEGV